MSAKQAKQSAVAYTKQGNSNWGAMLSTVDLLIKVAGFFQSSIVFSIYKASGLN